MASLEGHYRAERYGLSLGVREARDRFVDSDTQTSRQLLFGGDWRTPDRKLTLRATHEQSLGEQRREQRLPDPHHVRCRLPADSSASACLPSRNSPGGTRRILEGTRVGFRATPWQGGEVRSAVERQMVENGERVFALFGLGQSWQASERWSLDLSIDRSYTVKNRTDGERVNDNVPPASGGDDDFTAVSLGAAYKAESWSWWNRLETRQADSEDKVGISSGVVGDLQEGLAASASLMAFLTDESDGGNRDEEELRLGLAYRPNGSRWIVLERLDLEREQEDDGAGETTSWRVVNHLHANYRPGRQWQASCYYGLKYVREDFDGDRYDGYTDMLAAETRYNLNARWDVGLNGAALHSWNSHQVDYSAGASVGFLLMTNTWISAGYNLAGFEDDDFSAANYTAQGPFVRFRVKFDQQSVREAAEWLNR